MATPPSNHCVMHQPDAHRSTRSLVIGRPLATQATKWAAAIRQVVGGAPWGIYKGRCSHEDICAYLKYLAPGRSLG